MKKVVVVILNYKVKEEILRCLKSVEKSDYKNLGIVVVDNDSADGLEEELDLKKIDFVQTGANLGYTGGNNVGIQKALDLGADLVLVLNPDTQVEKDTISILVRKMEENHADVIGPKIYFSESKVLWFAGGKMDLANVLGSHIGVDEEDKGQYDKDIEVDYITGAALLVKREVFEKIGLFDDNYFLYYEDSDFCYRAKENGFKVMFIPEAVVYHDNAKSTGLGSPLQDYFITRNRMLFAKRHLSLRTQFALLREAFRNSKMPVRRQALKDFLTNNLGKGSFIK